MAACEHCGSDRATADIEWTVSEVGDEVVAVGRTVNAICNGCGHPVDVGEVEPITLYGEKIGEEGEDDGTTAG